MYTAILDQCSKVDAQLVIVSKTRPISAILKYYQLGHRIFGENRVQELVDKQEALPKDILWHLIGTLQTNKVKYIAPFISCIHSVDRMALLKEINKQAQKNDRQIDILLQYKIAEEESKNGASEQEIVDMVTAIKMGNCPNVKCRGLMAMATFTDDTVQIREEFNEAKLLFDRIKRNFELEDFNELSMGMSGDYAIALEEGSTMIRVGSLLF